MPAFLSLLAAFSPAEALASHVPHAQAPSRLAIHGIRPETNPSVRAWISQFSGPDHDRFERFMARGARYKKLIEGILVREGVPAELYYMAMIESGFVTHARSRTQALGIWQFMRSTGRTYGLRSTRYVDERLDVIRATRAAAWLLRDLKREFGSWYLAMAAYNAGAGRIRSAIRRGRTRDFWLLARRGYLPYETAEYVPQFQAAMAIARHPHVYGFKGPIAHGPTLQPPRKKRIRGGQRLSDVAESHGVTPDALKALNPHLIREMVPPGKSGYEVWVPAKRRSRG